MKECFPFLLLATCKKFVYLEGSHKSNELGEEGCGGTGARVLSKELHHSLVGILERDPDHSQCVVIDIYNNILL